MRVRGVANGGSAPGAYASGSRGLVVVMREAPRRSVAGVDADVGGGLVERSAIAFVGGEVELSIEVRAFLRRGDDRSGDSAGDRVGITLPDEIPCDPAAADFKAAEIPGRQIARCSGNNDPSEAAFAADCEIAAGGKRHRNRKERFIGEPGRGERHFGRGCGE